MLVKLEMMFRLFLAAGLGASIGYQRTKAGKAAGWRTHILICLGAAMFTITSHHGFTGTVDPSRIAAGIVAGVGFLGAGAIIRLEEGFIAGLTTAATIWVVAAIGLGAGAGLYLVSITATAITLVVLFLPHRLD